MSVIQKTLFDCEDIEHSSIRITDSFDADADAVVLCDDVLSACGKLRDETFQLIVSSPPYNIGKSYEKQVGLEQYLDWQAQVAAELVRLLSPRGSLVW